MKLYYTSTSPFARKIRLAMSLLKLESQIELVSVDLVAAPSEEFKKANPVIKVPALIMKNGKSLANSPFIVDYLDSLSSGRKMVSPFGDERYTQLQIQAIADGGCDAAVLRLFESRRRPHLFDEKMDQRQKGKIVNALESLEKNYFLLKSPHDSETWSVAEISVISFLGYLDFRFSKDQFLEPCFHLKNWHAATQVHTCVSLTKP